MANRQLGFVKVGAKVGAKVTTKLRAMSNYWPDN